MVRIFRGLSAWAFQLNRKSAQREIVDEKSTLRRCRFETMEPRCLLNADPIFVGAVYIEDDSGSDVVGDTFEINFTGGAAGTELTRVVIDGDKNQGADEPQPGEIRTVVNGDVFFDTVQQDPSDPNGLGQLNAVDLEIVAKTGQFDVQWSVVDGTTRLVLDFTGFTAGDKLVFSIDVDEANDLSFKGFDGNDPNAGVDSIASGNEFQGSHLRAEFAAPHFFDASVQTIFVDRYDIEQQALSGLPAGHTAATTGLELSPDDVAGKVNRTAGGAGAQVQIPMPISIAGRVYHDRDLDLTQDANDEGIAGVTLSLFRQDAAGVYQPVVDTGGQPLTTITDGNGDYEFGLDLNLPPGVYQVRETQPAAFPISVGAVPGQVQPIGGDVGAVLGTDILTEISIPLGDSQGVNYDFAEAKYAQLSGFVYHDRDNDGLREPAAGEEGIGNVRVALLNQQGVEVAHTFTQPDGSYAFLTLQPGVYTVVEQHPNGWIDGLDTAGLVQRDLGGAPTELAIGAPVNPGDRIQQVALVSDDRGENYNFGERLGGIEGFVHRDPDGDCVFDVGEAPIAGVTIHLLDAQGQIVATQTTDENGRYRFADLQVGEYSVVEIQPPEFFNHGQTAGVNQFGQPGGGDASEPNVISGIQIGAGDNVQLQEYNFCEHLGRLSGFVYHDRDNDGVREAGGNEQGRVEEGIAGVTITLFDEQGFIAHDIDGAPAITVTNGDGFYEFTKLKPGVYRVVEAHPPGWIDGIDTPGTVDGQPVGASAEPDDIVHVALNDVVGASGVGVNYNFGERLGSIAGLVFADIDEDCLFDQDEAPIAGVLITLLDSNGNVVAQQRTDENGRYKFDDLAPGEYSVVEQQPEEYFNGKQMAGQVGNGDTSEPNVISAIRIDGGAVHLTDYNFCEHPGGLSGFVYHDRDNDGLREPNGNERGEIEEGIAGVTLRLFDSQGNPVLDDSGQPLTTVTDEDGFYKFTRLAPGLYRIAEVHPAGWTDGIDTPGTVNGASSGFSQEPDEQRSIDLTQSDPTAPGKNGVNYNFGEYLPASIEGYVHVDPDGDCIFDDGELPLAGVTVTLTDERGNIWTTQTDDNGHYRFDNLPPGVYTVVEDHPDGYFQGGQIAGVVDNGDDSQTDVISQIDIRSGDELLDYNFCEIPPASIAGFVFQDGATITTIDGQPPADLLTVRDGQRTPDDTPIAGVVLELRNVLGQPLGADRALPGAYTPGPIRVVTDANGFYQFKGLRAGSYAVYQVHPATYIDGIDTAGTIDDTMVGFPVNANQVVNDPGYQATLNRLSLDPATDPGADAILLIGLNVGDQSIENNFSEVRVNTLPPPPPPPPQPPVIDPPPPVVFIPPVEIPPPPVLPPPTPPAPVIASGGIDYTWHLSVIDAGAPRGETVFVNTDNMIWMTSTLLDHSDWTDERLRDGRFRIPPADGEADDDWQEEALAEHLFGIYGALAVVGDWNGDGISEIGLFYGGEWFIDLNGNGVWDDNDLWARLGNEMDMPVAGDWDGDGKDDIGIFGPIWPGDPKAIQADPGLPDPANLPKDKPKNVPPELHEATDGRRVLKRTEQGRQRSDVIDHVFHYGGGAELPVAGDWNGDGIDAIGVFHDGRWRLDLDGDGRWGDGDAVGQFGQAGDTPIVGDFDGDGIDEIGVFRAGEWMIDTNRNRELDAHDRVFHLGGADDQPLVGDFNGDGIDEPGLYRDLGAAARLRN